MEEVAFFKDQVLRLSTELSKYQQKYPPISHENVDLADANLPWLTDRSLMAPLLYEYDIHISELTKQIESYKDEHQTLKSQMQTLQEENARYFRHNRMTIQDQLSTMGVSATNVSPTDGVETDNSIDHSDLLVNLQARLSNAVADSEEKSAMLGACQQEIDRLKKEVQHQLTTPLAEIYETQARDIKMHYDSALEQFDKERISLVEQLRSAEQSRDAAKIEVHELRHKLKEMKAKLIYKDQECNQVAAEKENQEVTVDFQRKEFHQLDHKLFEVTEEMSQLKEDNDRLEKQIVELNNTIESYKQSAYDAKVQVGNSVVMAENALLEKDQALIREKQYSEQIENLKVALDQMVDTAGERTREEVDEVKRRCNKNIASLMEEIHALEMESSEKQAQMDRAVREKRAAESELEKIYREGMLSGNKDSQAFDDANRRACEAERFRDEAMMKLNTIQHQLNRDRLAHDTEISHHKALVEQQQQQLDKLKHELSDVNADRLKLLEETDQLKRTVSSSKQTQESVHRRAAKDRLCLENDLSLKRQEYEIRIQSVEDTHRSTMSDLRRLLTAQQKMSAKWKEECNTITQKFEGKVRDHCAEISRLKRRNDDLTKLLSESRNKTIQVEDMLCEYTQNIKRMEERVREAEARSESTSLQVAKQLSQARHSMMLNRQAAKVAKSNLTKDVESTG